MYTVHRGSQALPSQGQTADKGERDVCLLRIPLTPAHLFRYSVPYGQHPVRRHRQPLSAPERAGVEVRRVTHDYPVRHQAYHGLSPTSTTSTALTRESTAWLLL